jgi:ADP-heptose:LPS heptosyltransferase
MTSLAGYVAVNHYKLLNGFIRLVAGTLYNRVRTADHPRKILVVRKGTLGDHLCSLPVINSLKEQFPSAVFDMLTFSHGQPGISITALVDDQYFGRIFDMDKHNPRALLKLIRTQQYDAVIELPQNLDSFYTQLRNLVFWRLAGIRAGAGWAVSNTLLFKYLQNRLIPFPNEQERLQQILSSYDIHTGIDTNLSGTLPTEETELPFDRYIVIAPGAKHSAKQWPEERFRELAIALLEQGHHIILLGDQQDRVRTETWQHPGLLNLCGQTSIPQSTYITRNALLTICNDSGPMHLSYHTGTPVVAIFSARAYKGKWFPPNDGKNRVIGRFDVPCAVCLLSSCNNHICMEQIPIHEVLHAAQDILTSGRS